MKIYFVEVEPSEREFFESELAKHELHFVSSLEAVQRDAEIVSTFIYSRIDGPFLDRHPAVKLIATRSTTHDHLELESCAKRNVTMCIVPSYGDHVVAEHTFALLLAVSRRLRASMTLEDDSRFSYEALRGFELRSKTFGILGAGRIGLHTVPMARSFGMNVIAYDIRPRPEMAAELGFKYVGFEQLLADSDIISLHANLNPSSYHILDRKAFAKCRPGVVVINTARGKLIDTNALIEALDQGIVRGAGLDVLGEESVMRRRGERIIRDQIIQKLHEPVERSTATEKGSPSSKGDRKAHASRRSAFATRGCLHAAHRIQLRGSHRADQSCHCRQHQSIRRRYIGQYTVAGIAWERADSIGSFPLLAERAFGDD